MASDTIRSPQSTGSNGGDMSYKYCRDRNRMVHLDVMLDDGTRFRKSTGRPATPANLKYVEKNWRSEVDRLKNKNKNKNKNEDPSDGEMTVEKYGYKSLAANKIYRAPATNTDYEQAFKKHIIPVFGSIAIAKVVQTDIKEWQSRLQEIGLSGKRIHVISTILQGIMRDAMNDNLIMKNPFIGLKGISRKALKEITPFTFEEVKYLLKHADGWFKNFLAVAFFTGMRTGELLALSWEDINMHSKKIIVRKSMSRGTIKETKTGESRVIDMLPPVEAALKEQYKETGLKGKGVFLSRWDQEQFTNTSTLGRHHWKPLLKRLMLPDRVLYNTRHSFATMMISKGEDIIWVSKMLGHANSSITLSVYARYREDLSVKRAKFLDDIDVYGSKKIAQSCHTSVTQTENDRDLKIS